MVRPWPHGAGQGLHAPPGPLWDLAGQGLGALPVQTGISNLKLDTPQNRLPTNQPRELSLSRRAQLSLRPHPKVFLPRGHSTHSPAKPVPSSHTRYTLQGDFLTFPFSQPQRDPLNG